MPRSSLYIFKPPQHRRQYLLDHADGGPDFDGYGIGEPVQRFAHSPNAPLLVLASFEDNMLTHIAAGRKGIAAGTGLVRLNLTRMEKFTSPLAFPALIELVPGHFRTPLQNTLDNGGLLPPKMFAAVVDALQRHDPALAERLARFSQTRADLIRLLTDEQRRNLAVQKETVAVALEIAGLPREILLDWSPSAERPSSFLDGLPGVHLREDAMLATDFTNLPGFTAIAGASHVAALTFENPDDPDNRLTIIMANRLPLEEQTGADLIYYNELYRAFVLVQYKAMGKGNSGPEFRWQDGDQFMGEIARMEALLEELARCPVDADPDGFRLSSNPFFLKFCPRMEFNPDYKGLVSGIYLPLELWKGLDASGKLNGPRGGKMLSYENVGRRLTNTEFVTLVANSWVGTTIPQSTVLEQVIRMVLGSGKTVTFAVKRSPPPGDDTSADASPELPLDDLVDHARSKPRDGKSMIALGHDERFK
jgi:hypothetical protein